jgi:hypothetical protein
MDRTYFQKTNLSTLSSDNAASVHQWYRQLVQQATSANIDLCRLRSFDSLQALWPSNTVLNLVIEMAQALLTKIDPCIDKTNSVLGLIYAQEITNSDSKSAAHYFLHALLRHADLEFIDKIKPVGLMEKHGYPFGTYCTVLQCQYVLYGMRSTSKKMSTIWLVYWQ